MSSKHSTEEMKLVWAKLGSYRPWPGKMSNPPTKKKPPSKNHKWIYFFGTKNSAWVTDDCIWSYGSKRGKLTEKSKNMSAMFSRAVDEADNLYKQITASKVRVDSSAPKNLVANPSASNCQSAVEVNCKPSVARKVKASVKNANILTVKIAKQKGHTEKKKSHKLSHDIDSAAKGPSCSSESADSASQPSVLLSRLPKAVSADGNSVVTITENANKPEYVRVKRKVGVLGLGILGKELVRCLLKAGHIVSVWNRTASKCTEFTKDGRAKSFEKPSDLFNACDITVCCVADPDAAKKLIFMENGIYSQVKEGKSLVMLTSMDPDSSVDLAETISKKGGRYLESPISGSVIPGKRNLIALASGNKKLFDDCAFMYASFAGCAIYLGETGKGTKSNLILSTIMATTMAGLAEGMALADKIGVPQSKLLEILKESTINAPLILEKGEAMENREFATNMPLQHLQDNVDYALRMASELDRAMPVAAAANEMYVYAKQLKYAGHDVSAVYVPARY